MLTPTHQRLPILPPLLHQLCEIASCLGMQGPAMRVFWAFAFFSMLRQSNLAPSSSHQFDPTHHTCRGDIIFTPPGLLIIRWSKTVQCVGRAQERPIPVVSGHPADPVATFRVLLLASPTLINPSSQ